MPKFPRPPAPPVETKPTLPLSFSTLKYKRDHPSLDPSNFASNVIPTLMTQAVSPTTADNKKEVFGLIDRVAYIELRGKAFDLFLFAIDPATGDSAIHRAAEAGNVVFMDMAMHSFGRTSADWQRREYWVLLTHQNLIGNTALHAAARAGSLRGVKGVYRMFMWQSPLSLDKDGGPPAWEPDFVPAEDWTDVDEEFILPAIDFVCTKNRAGRDAAEEAREAGHEELAVWFEGLMARLDPDRMRNDEVYLREARLEALSQYYYTED